MEVISVSLVLICLPFAWDNCDWDFIPVWSVDHMPDVSWKPDARDSSIEYMINAKNKTIHVEYDYYKYRGIYNDFTVFDQIMFSIEYNILNPCHSLPANYTGNCGDALGIGSSMPVYERVN